MTGAELSPAVERLLKFLAQGLSYREIADELGVSIKTVESHRRTLGLYFHSQSRADIVRRAQEAGLIDEVMPTKPALRGTRTYVAKLHAEIDMLRKRVADAEGEGCTLHGDAPHGREAEELRAGLEALLKHGANEGALVVARSALYELLDRVQARDSLAHLRANERIAELEAEVAALRAGRAEAES